MNIEISRKVKKMAPSGIRAFFDLVLGMKDVISLGVGEPDFVTPWNIREKAIYSFEQGFTSYTSNKGLLDLRKHLCRFLKQKYDMHYDYDEELLVTVGVSEGLDLVMRAILNPKDKVLIPQPCYVSYSPTVELAGGEPVFIKTGLKESFKVSPQQIEAACCDPKVKAMILNYPCNPTGASYTQSELKAIAKIAKKNNLLIISDEVYDELTYDFQHTPMASLKDMKNQVVYLNGFSKVYAMTGFRIGWVCGPKKVIAAMTKIHQYTILCPPIGGQMAAIEALTNSHKSVQSMKREYNRRRKYIVNALNGMGLSCHLPQGAFYVFPSIESTKESAIDFAKNLLKEKKVALVPGTAFDDSCQGHVRISYASSYESIREAVLRLKSYLESKK